MNRSQLFNDISLNLANTRTQTNYPNLKAFLINFCQNQNTAWDDLIENLYKKIEPVIIQYDFILDNITQVIDYLTLKLRNDMTHNVYNVENTALHFAILCLQFTESADDVKTYDFCWKFLYQISNLLSVPPGVGNLYNRFNQKILDYFEHYLPLCSRQKIEIALLFSFIDTSFYNVIQFFEFFPLETYLKESPNQLFNSEMIQAIQRINNSNFNFGDKLNKMSLYEFNVMIFSKLFLQIFFTNFLIMNTPIQHKLQKNIVDPKTKIFNFFNPFANHELYESYILPNQEILDDSYVSTDDMLIIDDDDSKVINKLFLYFIKLYENTLKMLSTFEIVIRTLSKQEKIITLTRTHTRDQLLEAIENCFSNQKKKMYNFLEEKEKNVITLNDMTFLNFFYNCLKQILDNEILKNVFTDETYQTFQDSFNQEKERGRSLGLFKKLNEFFTSVWLVNNNSAVDYFKRLLSPPVQDYKRGERSAAQREMAAMEDLKDEYDATLLLGEQ